MANWYGFARSNYVRVTDIQALTDLVNLKCGGVEIVTKTDQATGDTLYAFLANGTEDGAFPSCYWPEDSDETEDYDFGELVMDFIPLGEILVTQTCGAEKLRYITGSSSAYCWAVKKNGKKILESKMLDLDEIYRKASKKRKITPTEATY